jgi:hypothetical protein
MVKCQKCLILKKLNEVNFLKCEGKYNSKICKKCLKRPPLTAKQLKKRKIIQTLQFVGNDICTCCQVFGEIYCNNSTKLKYTNFCLSCWKLYKSVGNLLNKYSLSFLDYYKMRRKQDGKCFICEIKKFLVIDHCHFSGKIRKLVCHKCNTTLGFLESAIKNNLMSKYVYYIQTY